MSKIDKLTPEQQADIQPTITKWLQYSRETDRIKQRETVEELYRRYISNGKNPLVVHVQSPIQAMILAKIWKPFWADFLPKLKKVGINIEDTSLGDSLDASLRASLGDSLSASLRASLRDSLSASLGDSLSDSLDDSLSDSLDDEYNSLLRVYWRVHYWYRASVSVVDFVLRHFSNSANLKINLTDAKLWVDVGRFLGLVLPYSKNMCIVVDNPTRTAFEQGVLSYDHGKAVEYSDGWGYYMLKGVRLTEEQFNEITSGKLTLPVIAQKNWGADVSSVAIQFLGADQLISGMNGKLIARGIKHKATLERLGEDKCRKSYQWAFRPETELYQVDNFMDTGRTEYCIKMWHPTVKDAIYVEWVDPEVGKQKDADLAQATAFSISKQKYLVSYEA